MISNVLSRFYSIFIGYITIIFITRNYSFSEYGEYLILLSYTSILSVIALLGVDKAIVSETKFKLLNNNKLLINVLLINVLISFLIVSIFSLIFSFDNYLKLLVLVIISVIIQFFNSLFLLNNKNKIYSLLTYITEISFFLFFLFIINFFFKDEFNLIDIAIFSKCILLFISTYLVSYNKILKFQFEFIDRNSLTAFFKETSVFLGSNIIEIVILEVDKILINTFLNSKSVGVYSTLDKISRLSVSIFNAISPLLMKKIAFHKHTLKARNIYVHYSSIVIAVSLPISFSLYYFREYIFNVFNDELISYELIFLGLLIARMIQYSSGYKTVMLQMSGLKNQDFYTKLLKLVLNGCLFYTFLSIFKLKLLGMVLTLIISILIYSIVQVSIIKRHYKIKYFQNIFYYSFLIQLLIYMVASNIGFVSMIIFELLYFIMIYFYAKKNLNLEKDLN
jgi:O-antigen/teichoic acid export membrane protein